MAGHGSHPLSRSGSADRRRRMLVLRSVQSGLDETRQLVADTAVSQPALEVQPSVLVQPVAMSEPLASNQQVVAGSLAAAKLPPIPTIAVSTPAVLAAAPVAGIAAALPSSKIPATSQPVTSVSAGAAVSGAAGGAALGSNEGMLAIQRLLKQPEPVTWLLVGESFTDLDDPSGFAPRSYAGVFSDQIRGRLERRRDTVIDATLSRGTARELRQHFVEMLARHQPTVTLLMLGWTDHALSAASRARFINDVTELVYAVRESGSIAVLQTPPPFITVKSVAADHLRACIEVLRKIAVEADVPLIDHARNWKDLAAQGHSWKDWVHRPSRLPNSEGHAVMTRWICERFAVAGPAIPAAAAKNVARSSSPVTTRDELSDLDSRVDESRVTAKGTAAKDLRRSVSDKPVSPTAENATSVKRTPTRQ